MRRILPIAVLVLLATACQFHITKDGGIYRDREEAEEEMAKVSGAPSGADAPPPAAWALTMKTKKKADGSAFDFLRVNRRLYEPFQVMLVAGVPAGEDQAGFTGNAQACIELDERATITDDVAELKWVLICARREGDGLRVRAQNQFVQLGSVLFPATDAVTMSIRHDGDDLIFEAAPATLPAAGGSGNGGLSLVATVAGYAPSTASDALTPSLGASFLAHPATVVFDAERIVTNGEPLVALSDAEVQAFALGAQLDVILEAVHLLNGTVPDADGAAAALAPVSASVETIRDAVLLLPVDKSTKKAKKKLNTALKKLDAAATLIEKEKPETKVMKTLGKAATAMLSAIEALDPVGP